MAAQCEPPSALGSWIIHLSLLYLEALGSPVWVEAGPNWFEWSLFQCGWNSWSSVGWWFFSMIKASWNKVQRRHMARHKVTRDQLSWRYTISSLTFSRWTSHTIRPHPCAPKMPPFRSVVEGKQALWILQRFGLIAFQLLYLRIL